MSTVKYPDFAALLAALRKTKGWMQQEFAARAGVTQQTVSRWEQGVSRPRAKQLPALSVLLNADLEAMTAAAGYIQTAPSTGQPEGAPTYDTPLPLQSLRPDSFENFSADFLARYYRNRAGVVNRFGGTGSKQDGIDIEVRGTSFGVHTFQCKRVEEFGEQKVHAAVAAQTYISDLKVLLLSNIASPKARLAIAEHEDWQLWDRIDISARFRELSMIDRRDLVDIYFRGQRQSLLGETESGPFQNLDQFFKGFTEPSRFFNHSWALVRREEELDQLTLNILDDSLLVTMLLGAPGNGKTRLLRDVVSRVSEQRPDIAVFFVSPTEDVKAQHLDELGSGLKLLIADDAHDRDDLAKLMRYASVPENKAKLLLSLRPYGRAMVRSQASLVAMDSPQVAVVELRTRTKEDALALATQVLQASGGPLEAATGIAELTYPTPLVTVLAAQIISKENTPLALIGNSENFQEHILARLEKIIAGQIVTGQDVPKLQAVLRVTALLQPVVFDDPNFLRVLLEVEGVSQEDAQRLLRLLSEGGVLFKRGLRHRLAPDLLADSIIQRNFIGASGAITPKVERVFDLADTEYLKHLLVNLGRLDWRLRNGETEGSTLLSSLARKLQWHDGYHNPHVQAVEAVAYYQPRLALNFAERLIEDNHGENDGVCGMVRNAVFNMDLLEDGCLLLWRAGRRDVRALNSQPSHGIRILKELAEFAPNKPVEYVERVVAFAIELLDRPATLQGVYTPFTILEGALKTEMEEITSSQRSLTITRYLLDFERSKTVRSRVVDVIISSLKNGPPRKAYLAAKLFSEALRSPMHDTEDRDEWDAAHADLLNRVNQSLDRPGAHPVVLVQAGMSVSWHALYNKEPSCRSKAKAVIGLLTRDLSTRFIRLIGDAWGHQTWEDDESFRRRAHEADTLKMIEELSSEYPAARDLYAFLDHWLLEIEKITESGWGTPYIFINRLLQNRIDLSKEIMFKQVDTRSPLDNFAGVALSVLMTDKNRHDLIAKLLETNSTHAWELISEAYAHQSEDFFTDEDIPVLRQILQSKNPIVLRSSASIVRKIAVQNPALAVELICLTDLTICPIATRDFLMWLANRSPIPTEIISADQWRTLLRKLGSLKELDGHWVDEFLKKAIATVPTEVIEMLKARLQDGSHSMRYKSLRRNRNGDGLGLLSHPEGRQLLQDFLTWGVNIQTGEKLEINIGACVSGLCGKYDSQVLDLLLDLMRGGSQPHLNVVVSSLRCAYPRFVIDEMPFVREVLNQAELMGDKAVKDISSTLWSAAVTGGRTGIPGEPFKEDIELHEHAEKTLRGMGRTDPAYSLYTWLLKHAKDNIERQADEKIAMELDDE